MATQPSGGGGEGATGITSSNINLTTLVSGVGAHIDVLRMLGECRARYDKDGSMRAAQATYGSLGTPVRIRISGGALIELSARECAPMSFRTQVGEPLTGQSNVRGCLLCYSTIGNDGNPTRRDEVFIAYSSMDILNTTSVAGAVTLV